MLSHALSLLLAVVPVVGGSGSDPLLDRLNELTAPLAAKPAYSVKTPSTGPVTGSFTLATFNVLGDGHTRRGGNKTGWASGKVRIRRAVQALRDHHVDVVGLQEFQRSQWREFLRVAGNTYRVYTSAWDTQNAVAWRTDKFTAVSGDTVAIPYFDGHTRMMPVVRLRANATGQEMFFGSFHNPADTRRYRHQAPWRALATRREVRLVNDLAPSGLPVFVTGDMNERTSYFCRLAAGTQMRSAFKGSTDGACVPPAYHGIDWIFGSAPYVTFDGYDVDRSAFIRRTSDHPLVTAKTLYSVPVRSTPTVSRRASGPEATPAPD
jgi:endonuclease/exonuclease/phosphatase family metal-dependent hydrolase